MILSLERIIMSKQCDHMTITALFIMLILCCVFNIFICNINDKTQDESDIYDYIIMNYKNPVKI